MAKVCLMIVRDGRGNETILPAVGQGKTAEELQQTGYTLVRRHVATVPDDKMMDYFLRKALNNDLDFLQILTFIATMSFELGKRSR